MSTRAHQQANLERRGSLLRKRAKSSCNDSLVDKGQSGAVQLPSAMTPLSNAWHLACAVLPEHAIGMHKAVSLFVDCCLQDTGSMLK